MTSERKTGIIYLGGAIYIDDETEHIHERQASYIPPGKTQKIENTGPDDLAFPCIVDPTKTPEFEEPTE